ncbi:hypothetical protein KY326_01675 [Candidatus Woesearchaeota archaeon]|nr:hypothetical protein [Candidatus Woesearchaeota archaeon]
METQKLINLLKRFNPHCEHITLSTIFMKMRVGEDKFNVINYGPPGTGKSYSSIEMINKLNLGNDIIIDNNTTKRGLFELLVEYPEYDFILDECTSIMRDKGTQDMINLVMEGKQLNWVKNKSHEVAPVFKGNFILNVNQGLLDALTDRCFVNMTLMNKKMAMDFIDYYIADTEEHKELIAFLKKKIQNTTDVELSKADIEYVSNFVKKEIERNDENLGYSRRIIVRMVSYFKRVKKLFGKIDDEVKTFIEPYAAIYIENKKTPTIIETLLGNEKMDKIALIHLLSSETGYSERHARRLIDEELTKGRIKQFGRSVFI